MGQMAARDVPKTGANMTWRTQACKSLQYHAGTTWNHRWNHLSKKVVPGSSHTLKGCEGQNQFWKWN
jgi:hypothetical protein